MARRGSHSRTEAVFEIRVSQAERCQCFGGDTARHRCKPTMRNRRLKEGRSTVETALEDRSGSSLGISRRVTTEGEHWTMHPNPIAPPPNPRGSRLKRSSFDLPRSPGQPVRRSPLSLLSPLSLSSLSSTSQLVVPATCRN